MIGLRWSGVLLVKFIPPSWLPGRSEQSVTPASTPATVVALGAATVLVIHTARALWFAWTHAYFANDDLRIFWWSATKPFGEFVLDPVDDHLVPLHKLVSWVLFRVAPMNFAVGLGLLAALHVGTLIALFRLLHRLRPGSPLNAVLVCLYGLGPCVATQFLWWLAGLGRLGCIFFSVLAIDAYLTHRSSPSRGSALRVIALATCALGFYVKGILLPLYFAAIEVALPSQSGSRLKNLRLVLVGLVPVAVGYIGLWTIRTHPGFQQPNLDAIFHLKFLWVSLPLFAQSSLGFFQDQRAAIAVLVTMVVLSSVAFTVHRARRAILSWALLACLVVMNLSMVALSGARTAFQGLSIAGLDRYYFDAAFLVPLFVTLAMAAGDDRNRQPVPVRSLPRAWGVAASSVAILALISASSLTTLARIQSSGDFLEMMRVIQTAGRAKIVAPYPMIEATRRYVRNLEASLAALPEEARNPLELVDGELPAYVTPWGDVVRLHSELLALLGEQTQIGPAGKYVIDASGSIRPAPTGR
jgi:hypothetical protein